MNHSVRGRRGSCVATKKSRLPGLKRTADSKRFVTNCVATKKSRLPGLKLVDNRYVFNDVPGGSYKKIPLAGIETEPLCAWTAGVLCSYKKIPLAGIETPVLNPPTIRHSPR